MAGRTGQFSEEYPSSYLLNIVLSIMLFSVFYTVIYILDCTERYDILDIVLYTDVQVAGGAGLFSDEHLHPYLIYILLNTILYTVLYTVHYTEGY